MIAWSTGGPPFQAFWGPEGWSQNSAEERADHASRRFGGRKGGPFFGLSVCDVNQDAAALRRGFRGTERGCAIRCE